MYINKGEFIFALSHLNEYKRQIEECQSELSRCEYLLYGKIRNPLNYDVCGYDSKKETIRMIKLGGHISSDQQWDIKEELEQKKLLLEVQIKNLKLRVKEAEETLEQLEEPLKTMCIYKFVEGLTYEQVRNKLGNMSTSSVYRFLKSELTEIFDKKKE